MRRLLPWIWVVASAASALRTTHASPQIAITFPPPHSWWQVSPATDRLHGVALHFDVADFRIPEDGFVRVDGEKAGKMGLSIVANVSVVGMGGFEAGSYFFTLRLVRWGEEEQVVAEAKIHMEVVTPNIRSTRFTHVVQNRGAAPPLRRVKLMRASNVSTENQRSPMPVCFVTTSNGPFDGQKKMWIQMIDAFGGKGGQAARFRFAAMSFLPVDDSAPVARAFARAGVPIVAADRKAFQVAYQELLGWNVTNGEAEGILMESFYAEFPDARHDINGARRLGPQDRHRLHLLEPAFTARVWLEHVRMLHEACDGGVVVFATSRSVGDALVTHAAHLAGARAVVMELANLYSAPLNIEVLFAPSRFALHHPSIKANVRAQRSYMAATGINTDVFAPRSYERNDGEFVIGFVGRLSTDKSGGVLLATARLLRQVCSFCKLRMIGNGPLKADLLALADEWSLGDVVEFMAGIYDDEHALAAQLQRLDVYATPAFRETLGIAVLEAMSVGLPVVGYIAAGTSEFLVDGVNCVSVEERSPEAFRDAILMLVNNQALRSKLSRQARQSVVQRFAQAEWVQEIGHLYDSFESFEEAPSL